MRRMMQSSEPIIMDCSTRDRDTSFLSLSNLIRNDHRSDNVSTKRFHIKGRGSLNLWSRSQFAFLSPWPWLLRSRKGGWIDSHRAKTISLVALFMRYGSNTQVSLSPYNPKTLHNINITHAIHLQRFYFKHRLTMRNSSRTEYARLQLMHTSL